jgi:uncharacterized protein YdgA (DUF945 family)
LEETHLNRWFVVILIMLALIILVSPGIVGRLAEKSVEENFEFAASDNDDIVVRTESFRRGWFTSEGRHRIELRNGVFGSLSKGAHQNDDGFPSLVVDTHIDHGLVPVTSMARDSGSLLPGLASTVSTVRLDPGSGELSDLPGRIYSSVGLTGATTSLFVLEAGSRSFADREAKWQGADITVVTNPETGAVSARGSISPWSVQGGNSAGLSESIHLETVTLDGHHRMSRYGISVGRLQIEIGSLQVETGSAPPIGFDKLALVASSDLEGDKVNAESRFSLTGVNQPELGDLDFNMAVSVNGADASSLQKITQALRNAQTALDPQQALAESFPLFEPDLQNLLTSGIEIRFDQLDISLPAGELTSRVRISLPPSDSEFSWPSLLLSMDASADLRLPVALYEMAQLMSPDLGMLLAMGILELNDEHYEMRAEYAKGLVTVNGAPMPIPLPQ